MHHDAMNDETADSCTRALLSCLGEASRYRLVRALAGQDLCVGELALAVGLSQSCTTRHLQALERAGVVRGRREGRKVRFRLSAGNPALEALLAWALAEPASEPAALAPAPVSPQVAVPTTGNRSARERSVAAGTSRRRTSAAAGVRQSPDSPVPEPTDDARTTSRPGDLEDFLL
jgi:ArsR family transcriptional regulator, virulence genes transcriptional regulator